MAKHSVYCRSSNFFPFFCVKLKRQQLDSSESAPPSPTPSFSCILISARHTAGQTAPLCRWGQHARHSGRVATAPTLSVPRSTEEPFVPPGRRRISNERCDTMTRFEVYEGRRLLPLAEDLKFIVQFAAECPQSEPSARPLSSSILLFILLLLVPLSWS